MDRGIVEMVQGRSRLVAQERRREPRRRFPDTLCPEIQRGSAHDLVVAFGGMLRRSRLFGLA